VRDDVVELAQLRRGRLEDVEHAELDVGQCQLRRQAATARDGRGRQVDAEEAGLRQPVGHRYQVGAIAAPQLQHAAACHCGRLHPVEHANGREAGRVRIGEGVAG
jgi:hypothetical protein